ncbi:MAG: hypothetical protein IKG40_00835 [Bacilli bacterium]|nr:hypothetical protein [Bacilli bacterium]
MNIDELLKQKEKLENLKKRLEEKEEKGEKIQTENKIYIIGKNLEIIDTRETRVKQKLEEECSHPVLWQVNYNQANLEYYNSNTIKTYYWYYCMHCGKLITDKIKPKTDYIITAPNDMAYVYFIRKQLLPNFQEEYFKILNESNESEITIEEVNERLNKRFNKQKVKTL